MGKSVGEVRNPKIWRLLVLIVNLLLFSVSIAARQGRIIKKERDKKNLYFC